MDYRRRFKNPVMLENLNSGGTFLKFITPREQNFDFIASPSFSPRNIDSPSLNPIIFTTLVPIKPRWATVFTSVSLFSSNKTRSKRTAKRRRSFAASLRFPLLLFPHLVQVAYYLHIRKTSFPFGGELSFRYVNLVKLILLDSSCCTSLRTSRSPFQSFVSKLKFPSLHSCPIFSSARSNV